MSPRRSKLFVIQKHAASTLHYDFRLEVGRVLRSWAVPKGPSTDPRHKRLAMAVEDHSLGYARFEGVIEAGYGAGTVIVWDIGTYENVTERDGRTVPITRALKEGHAVIELNGEKLRGGYALTRVGGSASRERVDPGQDPRRQGRRPAQPGVHPARVRPDRTHDRGRRGLARVAYAPA